MERIQTQQLWTRDFFWIVALSLSYFYCLPLLRTGVILGITASEIRIYDVVFAFVIFIFIIPRFSQFMAQWRNMSTAHRYLFYWVIIAFFGLLLLMLVRGDKFFIGMIRYIRFFSYSSVFVLIYLMIKNKRQLNYLYLAVVMVIIFISILGTLQSLRIIPNFWPDYYSAYWRGEDALLSTATLAPNHTHYSLVMAIGIIMVFARLKVRFQLSLLNMFLIAGLIPMIYSMIISQGRSGWLVMAIYFGYSILVSKGKILTALLLVAAVFLVFIFFDSGQPGGNNLTVRETLLYRSINSHKDLGKSSLDIFDEEDKNFIERVDDNRWFIYKNAMVNLANSPQYWLFGAGFQNASRAIGGVALAAHNAYINVFAEHGIIGLTVYLIFLYQLFLLAMKLKKNANSAESYCFANEWMGLFFGLLAANFFGEVIYPGRALFTFLGTFFVVTGLFLHPAWRNSKTTA